MVLYADSVTDSIRTAVTETERRRVLQMDYNRVHGIVPETIIKAIPEKEVDLRDTRHIPRQDIPNLVIELEAKMKVAAENLEFEEAIRIRDRIRSLKERQEH